MKSKTLTIIICIVLITTMSMSLTACDLFNSDPKEYTIQYTDDSGLHELTVTEGNLYSLETIPEREGYIFAGLFDAEIGGTQYVSATGSALSAFTDGRSMILYPQFKAKEYTLILDYQGAQVTGSRQLTVAYGSSLPELPKNLALEHKEFAGWYTAENCGGVQVADSYGLIPMVSVFNKDNFDITKDTINLYAGFEVETFDVICCFEAGMDTETVKVAYDTPVSQIVPQTRVNGNAPITWSKSQGGEVFNGKVTSEMVLYAVEYAPVIELDSNGGSYVKPVVARAGSTISLPTPTKDLTKFAYWEDMQGNRYTSTTMPSKSISLKAVWQAKIVFDENGGTDVNDISEMAGTTISLPTPEKEGFIFAGWYTWDGSKYSTDSMPVDGIMLYAKYYVTYTAQSKTLFTSDAKSFTSDVYATKFEWSQLPDEFQSDGLEITMTVEFDGMDEYRGLFLSGAPTWVIKLVDTMNESSNEIARYGVYSSNNSYSHYKITLSFDSTAVVDKTLYVYFTRGTGNLGTGYIKNLVSKYIAVNKNTLY